MKVAVLLLCLMLGANGGKVNRKDGPRTDKERLDGTMLLESDAIKCTQCLAIAWELGALLSTEKARPDVKRRGGGKGKKVAYLESEVRTAEMIEGLCPLMSGYGLYTREDDKVSLYLRTDLQSGPTPSMETTRALRLFCDFFVEEHEEKIESIIKLGVGIGAGDMETLAINLCSVTSKHCKDKEEVFKKIPMTPQYKAILKDQEQKAAAAKKEDLLKQAKKDFLGENGADLVKKAAKDLGLDDKDNAAAEEDADAEEEM